MPRFSWQGLNRPEVSFRRFEKAQFHFPPSLQLGPLKTDDEAQWIDFATGQPLRTSANNVFYIAQRSDGSFWFLTMKDHKNQWSYYMAIPKEKGAIHANPSIAIMLKVHADHPTEWWQSDIQGDDERFFANRMRNSVNAFAEQQLTHLEQLNPT